MRVSCSTRIRYGYPGVFHDYASYVGWAMLERYVSEELIGAAIRSWGGLTQNPVTKSAVTLALHQVNPRHPAAFLQGDTIGNTPDFDSNMAVLCTDMLFAKALDMKYRLGGALLAVPLTETERIPNWSEVAAVQAASRKLDEYVPMVDPVIDWAADRGAQRAACRGRPALLFGRPHRYETDGGRRQ